MTIYLRPSSFSEALQMRADHPDFTVFAGGTDLMNRPNDHAPLAGMLDLFAFAPFVGISKQGNWIQIGAATTCYEIVQHPLVSTHLPCLRYAASQVGSPQIQARGTIGGNVATSSPLGDLLPILLVLNAQLVLASSRGERQLPYCDFCTGYRSTALQPDELIVAVKVSVPPDHAIQFWRKVGTRRIHGTSKVMVVGYAEKNHNEVTVARVGLGAVANRPIRLTNVEQLLVSNPLEHSQIIKARQMTLQNLSPISDVRSTAHYRRLVAANLVGNFVDQLLLVRN